MYGAAPEDTPVATFMTEMHAFVLVHLCIPGKGEKSLVCTYTKILFIMILVKISASMAS